MELQVAQLITIALGFISLLMYFRRLEKKFDFLLIEHEMLIADYAKRQNMEVADLPTRTGGIRL
jgi:hypothetical protein